MKILAPGCVSMHRKETKMSLIKSLWICLGCCFLGLVCCVAAFEVDDSVHARVSRVDKQVTSISQPAAQSETLL